MDERQTWEEHWQALAAERSVFGRLASLVRRTLLRGAVAACAARYAVLVRADVARLPFRDAVVSSGKPFELFPAEVNRPRSLRNARDLLRAGGLQPVSCGLTRRDAFIHIVAVGRKEAAAP